MKQLLVIACVLVVSSASAQERAPNRRDVVEQVSAADPARFACAHTERSCKNDWIKAVGAALHKIDARWGLNGKRGNANDLSMDVVTWRIGPTDRHVQAFDICGACGGGSPSVTWSDITNWSTIGQPGTAIWLKPEPGDESGSGGGGTPTPPQPLPGPDYTAQLNAIGTALADILARLGAVEGVLAETRDAAKSAEHDAREINQRPVPVLAVPCLTGRVPKAFGGSSEVTFCPVAP